MLVDQYALMDLSELVPDLGLDKLLEDDVLFQAVKTDLAKRRPRTWVDGRPSTPAGVILRL